MFHDFIPHIGNKNHVKDTTQKYNRTKTIVLVLIYGWKTKTLTVYQIVINVQYINYKQFICLSSTSLQRTIQYIEGKKLKQCRYLYHVGPQITSVASIMNETIIMVHYCILSRYFLVNQYSVIHKSNFQCIFFFLL